MIGVDYHRVSNTRSIYWDSTVTNKFRSMLALTLGALVLTCGASADAQLALQRRLEAATRIDCSFSVLATGNWSNNTPTATVSETDLTTSFYDINVEEGTAEADSRFGSSLIIVRYASGYLHLMQLGTAGPLHLTTVLARETKNGRLMAMHTRHEYTPTALPGFTSRPEMYIGDCEVTSD